MKYQKGDCFKRNDVTEGWNSLNKTTTIMVEDVGKDYYFIYSDFGYHEGLLETEIDKYFYRLYSKEDMLNIINTLSDEK
jgi:hypothetical protein